MGSDEKVLIAAFHLEGFNPRSRVGSDQRNAHYGGSLRVSIRAPAWGATVDMLKDWAVRTVSIRAPAWGATSRPCYRLSVTSSFNPRSRVGSDSRRLHRIRPLKKFQSALPRGERPRFCLTCSNNFVSFNPRSRVGSDSAGFARCGAS